MTERSLYHLLKRPLLFLDFETTGTNPEICRAIQAAGVLYEAQQRWSFGYYVDPGCPIPPEVQKLTGITDVEVAGAFTIGQVLTEIAWMLDTRPVIVAHNALFDISVLRAEQRRLGLMPWEGDFICTMSLARFMGKGMPSTNRIGKPYTSFELSDVAKALNMTLDGAHRADADIGITEQVFYRLYTLALAGHRPILNALTQPDWAPPPAWVPERSVTYLVVS